MDKVAVLIPCYNEEATIKKVVKDFRSVLPECKVYVYDNNSSDKTSEYAISAGAIVRKESKQGKGNVVRRMFSEIVAQCYILVDGDDTYPAEFAPQMVDKVLMHGIDMVVGDRLSASYFAENKRPFHNVGNSLVRWSINRLFKSNVTDILTGYRAFSYRFVRTFPVISRGFEIETEMTIHSVDKNLAIDHIVVQYRDRSEGSESKLRTFHDGICVLYEIVDLFRSYRPNLFFGGIAGILLLFSFGFFIPVALEYSQTGLVERFPTLIVCGFTAIAALISFFSGQVLETLNRKNRQSYEMELIKATREYNMLITKKDEPLSMEE